MVLDGKVNTLTERIWLTEVENTEILRFGVKCTLCLRQIYHHSTDNEVMCGHMLLTYVVSIFI